MLVATYFCFFLSQTQQSNERVAEIVVTDLG